MGASSRVFCAYFAAAQCRSCDLIEMPRDSQLALKQDLAASLLAGFVPDSAWLPPVSGAAAGFRNKAKFVVGGAVGNLTLGLWVPGRESVDLTECVIQDPRVNAAGACVRGLLNELGLAPYDVASRAGDLKFVHITVSDLGELLVRIVVRSAEIARIIEHSASNMLDALPEINVLTVNILPEHKAVLEGDEEWILHGDTLRMPLAGVELDLLPRSFFQTNTEIAGRLYAQVADWALAVRPQRIWDLYCGVGGFALVCADRFQDAGLRPEITGVEVSAEAISAARVAATRAGVDAEFIAADATSFAMNADAESHPDLLIVNPPRRGIGAALAEWIESSNIQTVVYSSCNPASLATDLAAMPSFTVQAARLFDMFPHTKHMEIAVLLKRL